MTGYHKFLLRHRPYCEADVCCLSVPTHVVNVNGRDTVLCDKHGIVEREITKTAQQRKEQHDEQKPAK